MQDLIALLPFVLIALFLLRVVRKPLREKGSLVWVILAKTELPGLAPFLASRQNIARMTDWKEKTALMTNVDSLIGSVVGILRAKALACQVLSRVRATLDVELLNKAKVRVANLQESLEGAQECLDSLWRDLDKASLGASLGDLDQEIAKAQEAFNTRLADLKARRHGLD